MGEQVLERSESKQTAKAVDNHALAEVNQHRSEASTKTLVTDQQGNAKASAHLPELELTDGKTAAKQQEAKPETKPEGSEKPGEAGKSPAASENLQLAKANEELNQRLKKIESSHEIADSQEHRLAKSIKESEKEISEHGFVDRMLNKTEREQEALKHKQEELNLVKKEHESADKIMNQAKPELEQIKKLVELEHEQREKGDIKQADETARQAQEQIQNVLKETDGVSYVTRDTLQKGQAHREQEIEAETKYQENLKTAKVVADTVRDGAVAGAAVVATGGTMALMAGSGYVVAAGTAAVAGTAAGTGVSALARTGEAVAEVFNDTKTVAKATSDALHSTFHDAKTAAITSVSTVLGLGVAAKITAAAATEANIAVTATKAGSISGGVQASVSSGIETTDRYQQAKTDFDQKYANLAPDEKAQRWEEYKKEQQLTAADITSHLGVTTVAGLASGAVGGRVGTVSDNAGQLTQTAVHTADLTSDATITVGSAYAEAKLQGREVTKEDLASYATNVVTGRMVGSAAGRAAARENNDSSNRNNGEHNEHNETPPAPVVVVEGQHQEATHSSTPDAVTDSNTDTPPAPVTDTGSAPQTDNTNQVTDIQPAPTTDNASQITDTGSTPVTDNTSQVTDTSTPQTDSTSQVTDTSTPQTDNTSQVTDTSTPQTDNTNQVTDSSNLQPADNTLQQPNDKPADSTTDDAKHTPDNLKTHETEEQPKAQSQDKTANSADAKDTTLTNHETVTVQDKSHNKVSDGDATAAPNKASVKPDSGETKLATNIPKDQEDNPENLNRLKTEQEHQTKPESKHDVDGRPLEGNFRTNIQEKFQDLSPEQQKASIEHVSKELGDVKAIDANGKPTSAYESLMSDPILSDNQKQNVLHNLSQIREHFASYRQGDRMHPDPEVNWIHTQGELAKVMEAARAKKLSPDQMEDAMLASMYSDSVKFAFPPPEGAQANFHTHHLDGALAAHENLTKQGFPPERVDRIVGAIKAHQIAPPGFMGELYFYKISATLDAKAKSGEISPEHHAELKEAFNNMIEKGEDGKTRIKHIANVEDAPKVKTEAGEFEVAFSPLEKELMAMSGSEKWTVPYDPKLDAQFNQRPKAEQDELIARQKVAQTLIDGDGIDNYATLGGASKIVAIRGPATMFKDATVFDSIASIDSSFKDTYSVLSPEGRTLADNSLASRNEAMNDPNHGIKKEMADWLRSEHNIDPDKQDVPYFNSPLKYPEALTPEEGIRIGQLRESLGSDNTKSQAPIDFDRRAGRARDENQPEIFGPAEQRAKLEAEFKALTYKGMSEEEIQQFEMAKSIRAKMTDLLRAGHRTDGELPGSFESSRSHAPETLDKTTAKKDSVEGNTLARESLEAGNAELKPYKEMAEKAGLTPQQTEAFMQRLSAFKETHPDFKAQESPALARLDDAALAEQVKMSALENSVASYHQATRDYSNEILNRAGMESYLHTLERSGELGDSNAVVLNLSNFKAANDTFDHQTGDMVLHAMSKYLHSAGFDGQLPVKLQGDKFVLIGTKGETQQIEQILSQTKIYATDEGVVLTGHADDKPITLKADKDGKITESTDNFEPNPSGKSVLVTAFKDREIATTHENGEVKTVSEVLDNIYGNGPKPADPEVTVHGINEKALAQGKSERDLAESAREKLNTSGSVSDSIMEIVHAGGMDKMSREELVNMQALLQAEENEAAASYMIERGTGLIAKEHYEYTLSRQANEGDVSAVIVADVKGFGNLNGMSTFNKEALGGGRLVGDSGIQVMADALREAVGNANLPPELAANVTLARIGGDEIGVILPKGISEEQRNRVVNELDSIRLAVSVQEVDAAGNATKVTVRKYAPGQELKPGELDVGVASGMATMEKATAEKQLREELHQHLQNKDEAGAQKLLEEAKEKYGLSTQRLEFIKGDLERASAQPEQIRQPLDRILQSQGDKASEHIKKLEKEFVVLNKEEGSVAQEMMSKLKNNDIEGAQQILAKSDLTALAKNSLKEVLDNVKEGDITSTQGAWVLGDRVTYSQAHPEYSGKEIKIARFGTQEKQTSYENLQQKEIAEYPKVIMQNGKQETIMLSAKEFSGTFTNAAGKPEHGVVAIMSSDGKTVLGGRLKELQDQAVALHKAGSHEESQRVLREADQMYAQVAYNAENPGN